MPLTQLSPDTGPTIRQHVAVTVYNSVNKKVRDVIDFLHEALLTYTKGGLLRVHWAEEFSLNLSIPPNISKDTADLPKQRKKSLFYFRTALWFAVRPVVASISVIEW
ncbi:hypothetical protein PV325_003678 [Microctonus aethiopoides]|nr:hypothetical protein PV325_003678 [Microctonus aethiopoides]KAK0090474.1 hypothetical protein PV326_004123 [Microctonus aethiopoides]